MLRTFIAITPPVTLQQSCAEVRAVVEQHAFPWRWVKPAQIHLTLKFLGDVDPARIDAITQAMQRAIGKQVPFTLLAQGVGCFPTLSRPRVLWMGLHDPQQALTRLQQRLGTALVSLGFAPEERPFRPHLTLARAPHGGPGRPQLTPLLQAYHEQYFGEVLVEHLHLFQSQLHRDGAVYTLLRSAPLQH
jgi:2'-5' RNA ligase